MHKPIRHKFVKRRVEVRGIDDIWAADLVDMQAFSKFNKGVKYLLMIIDVLSKYGWIIPLKTKTGLEVSKALKSVFKIRKPKLLWVDKGKEFYNKHVKNIVELYSTENEEKSCVVERWNRTMKEKMFKYFSANNTRKYFNVLDDFLNQYNNTVHSSIKMTPTEASQKQNENQAWKNLHDNLCINKNTKFKVGDQVRISRKKETFEKGYTPRWTEEVFEILQVQYTNPPTYKIKDLNGQEIKGTFYEQEMQKTTQEIYRIEKIIRRKGSKSYVKWLGYPTEFNSWVDNKDIQSLHSN